MTKKMKKFFALLLTVSMIMNTLGLTVFADNTEERLCSVCEEEMLHKHTESCYDWFVASGSDCWVATRSDAEGAKERLVCDQKEHVEALCVTAGDLAQINAVIALLEEIDTLQEMQDARKYYTVSGDYNADSEASVAEHKAAQAGYGAYVDAMTASRSNAQEAYNALSPNQKNHIPEELVEKLEDELDTWWVVDPNPTMTRTITPSHEEYTYQLVNTWRTYERTPHTTEAGNRAHLFILVDSDDGEHSAGYVGTDKDNSNNWLWRAEKQYQAGNSSYELAYCSDVSVSTVDGTKYKRVNPEDSGYYGKDAAEHIRAIVMNSYPFVTVEEMKENLLKSGLDKGIVAGLDRGEMIAAVQMAIWSYANAETDSVIGNTAYGMTYRHLQDKVWHDFANEHDYWWNSAAGYGTYYEEIETRINTLVSHLRSLEPISLQDDGIVINDVDIIGAEPVQAMGKDGVYSVAMKVQLNSGGSSSKDNIDIIVTSYDVDGTPNDTKSIDVTAGTTVYDITVEARYGEKIEVVVEGTQHLPTGAYFYQPEPSDRNGDGKFTSKETSQNLIGVSMGDTAVRASAVITDTEIPENKPETADLYIQKNNGSGESLAGAEFDLYKVSDTQTYNIGTFSVDSNGSLAIAGLLKGNYELKETKAPDGYSVSRGKVAFEVTAEDTIVFTQIDEAIQNLISTKDSTVTVRNEANTTVSVNKVWVEDRAVVRPTEIKVQLLKNGNAEGAPVVLNDSNGWKYTWNNLDRYDNWSVKEIDVPSGYTTTYANTGNVDNGYVCEITNTLIPEDKTFVAVNKVWKDDVEANRPTSVQVQLLKDGVAEGEAVTLSKENNWTYTWTDLVKRATWTVEEINVPTNYKASVSGTGNQYTITNTYEEPETTTSYVDDDDDEPTPKTTAPAETTPAPTETTPVPTETVPEPTVLYRGVEIPQSILDAYPGRTLDELFDMGVLGAYFENVPTGLLPATSDINPFWMILMVVSMIGLAVTSVLDKKRNN